MSRTRTRPSTRLRHLWKALDGAEEVMIVPHNNPDPDAIAASVAISYLIEEMLQIPALIGYRGIVGRAENRAITRYLGHPLQSLKVGMLRDASHIVLVDTQPKFGNNSIMPSDRIAAVIDHHNPIDDEPIQGTFVDVRPEIGAASTMLVDYLRAAKLTIPTEVATALFYGIKTDTMALERSTSPLDHKAFCYLLPFVDFEAVGRVERATVSPEYFGILVETLQSTLVYDHLIVSHIPVMDYPDLTADIADMLLRTRGCRWTFCSGLYKETIYFSIRTENKRGAGELARKIVGERGTAGGHGSIAGGQIPVSESSVDEDIMQLREEVLKHLAILNEQESKPFVSIPA